MKWLALVVCAGALCSACASAQAKAPADRPTLEVPPPPTRVIEPLPHTESPGPEPVGDLPPASPTPASRPRPNPTRETPKPEPKPPETAPAAEPPATAAPPPAPIPPAPQLRTPGSADGPEAAKQVRDMIDGAKKALNSVNYQRLTNAQRGQYNNAKLMLTQAEEQLKASNFDLARNNAEKANRIATELQGR
jgi:hypothetical protein